MRKTFLSWVKNPYVILLLIDLLLSNIWEFWRDKKSANLLYKNQEGWMDWFYLDLFSMYCRPMLLCVAILMSYILRIRMQKKHVWFVVIYLIMLIKDAFDFIQDGNKSALTLDLVVFLVTIFVCECIDQVTQKSERHGNG